MSHVGILDLGTGNLRSVANAVSQLGYDPVMIADGSLGELTHLIIPGVGQFAAAMGALQERGFLEELRSYANSGRPLLGICLGMHILATRGTEGGLTEGLALVPGLVDRLTPGEGIRVPHVGWNTVRPGRPHPLLTGLKPDRDFYFVHSYVFHCENSSDILAETEYGAVFPSIVGRGNVVGFQFHPEKSQVNGLKLLENFCGWDGRC